MQLLTSRASPDGLSVRQRADWTWSQQQLRRVRSSFEMPTTPAEGTGARPSMLDRGLGMVQVAIHQGILGMALPFIGARYILRHRVLWKWALSPVFVAGAVIGLVVLGMVVTVGASAASLAAVWGLVDGWAAGLGMAALGVMGVVLVVGLLVAGGLGLTYGLLGLCGPFLEFLAEGAEDVEAEVLWTDWSAPRFTLGVLVRNLLITAVSWVFFLLVGSVVAASATAIPVIGWVAGPLLFFASQGWIATGEYIGTVRLWTIREKLHFIRTHPWVFIGCGFLTTVISVMIPFFALPVVVPCSVVGFTLVLVWLQHEGVAMPLDRRIGDGPRGVEVF